MEGEESKVPIPIQIVFPFLREEGYVKKMEDPVFLYKSIRLCLSCYLFCKNAIFDLNVEDEGKFKRKQEHFRIRKVNSISKLHKITERSGNPGLRSYEHRRRPSTGMRRHIIDSLDDKTPFNLPGISGFQMPEDRRVDFTSEENSQTMRKPEIEKNWDPISLNIERPFPQHGSDFFRTPSNL